MNKKLKIPSKLSQDNKILQTTPSKKERCQSNLSSQFQTIKTMGNQILEIVKFLDCQ